MKAVIKNLILIAIVVALYLFVGFASGVAQSEPAAEQTPAPVDMSDEDPFNPEYLEILE